MGSGLSFMEWPAVSGGEILLFAAASLLLLVVAVAVEMHRRRAFRAAIRDRAWEEVDRIIGEKDLSEGECRLVRAVLERYASKDPLVAVTSRRRFNVCAAEHISEVQARETVDICEGVGIQLHDVRRRLALDFIPLGHALETTRELTPGQVIMVGDPRTKPTAWSPFRLFDINEAYLYLQAEAERDRPGTMRAAPGDTLRCHLWREEDARYGFEVELVTVRDDTPPRYVTTHADALRRIQSRADLRARVNQPVHVGIVTRQPDDDFVGASERPVTHRVRGRLVSLSGGGIAVEVSQALPAQVLLRVSVDIPDFEPLPVTARIVGSSAIAHGGRLVRGAFVDISDETRDTIAQYVVRRQQPLRSTRDADA